MIESSPVRCEPTAGPSRATVLVVEDSAFMRDYMRNILADLYNVIAVANGREALVALRTITPAVVVSDILMPEMDGYELVRHLKADAELRNVQVVLVTSKTSTDEVVSGLEMGADDYIGKPFGPAELRARVRACERQQRTCAELEARHQELEQALEALHETQDELIQVAKMAALGTLAAGMSHELNNPLSTILITAQSLLRCVPPDGAMRPDLEMIARNAERSGQLIRLLLDFSRRKPVATERVSIPDLLERAVALAGAEVHGRDVTLTLESSEPDLPFVEGAVQQLEVAVLNLVKNGVDAVAGTGRVAVGATRALRAQRPGVEIVVKDTGCGISEQVLPRIFDPFFTTKPVGMGTGLGLALTRRIIESHGGQVTVETQLGVGTAMHVWLPLDGGAAAPEAEGPG